MSPVCCIIIRYQVKRMDTKLLQKFYRGECSEEEVQEVLGWFSSKAEKEAMMDQLKEEWTEFEIHEGKDFESYNPLKF